MRLVIVLVFAAGVSSTQLTDLYEKMALKVEKVKENKLQSTIIRSVPYGLPKLQPALSEYETFRQNPTNNFIHDEHGNVIFRQFRRLSLSSVFSRQQQHRPASGHLL